MSVYNEITKFPTPMERFRQIYESVSKNNDRAYGPNSVCRNVNFPPNTLNVQTYVGNVSCGSVSSCHTPSCSTSIGSVYGATSDPNFSAGIRTFMYSELSGHY